MANKNSDIIQRTTLEIAARALHERYERLKAEDSKKNYKVRRRLSSAISELNNYKVKHHG